MGSALERLHCLQSALESALHGVEHARQLWRDPRLDHAARELSRMLEESEQARSDAET